MKTRLLPVLILCTAGAAMGAGIGWFMRGNPAGAGNPPNGSSGAGVSSAGKWNSGLPGGKAAAKAGSEADDHLASQLARCTGAMRWLFLLASAEKATPADMPALLRAVKGDSAATRMLAVRWAEMDPKHMFDTLCADRLKRLASRTPGADRSDTRDLLTVLFEEWPKHDKEGAIAALSDLRRLPDVEHLRFSLVNTIMKTDPERALKLVKEWNVRNYIPNMDSVAKWAAENPLAAARAVMENTSDHVRTEAMDKISKVWAATDPAAVLAFADQTRGLTGARMVMAAVKEWAKNDLAGAIKYVSAETDSLTKTRLGLPLLETWAKTDSQAALQWAQENLKGEGRAAAAGYIVKAMAEKDIQAASAFIAGLDPGGLKNRAVNQLVETWLSNQKPGEIPATLAWISSLPEADARNQAWQQASWRLFFYSPDETISFLNSDQGHNASQQVFDNAARYLAKKNPDTAMQWASGLPADRAADARQNVLETWLGSRPEAATAWVEKLPAGAERDESIRAVVSRLSYQSLEQTKTWLESLPEADRGTARAAIGKLALPPEKRDALSASLK
jgi:hypothetical protein